MNNRVVQIADRPRRDASSHSALPGSKVVLLDTVPNEAPLSLYATACRFYVDMVRMVNAQTFKEQKESFAEMDAQLPAVRRLPILEIMYFVWQRTEALCLERPGFYLALAVELRERIY